MIALARLRHDDPVDADVETVAADFLSRKSGDALDQWRAHGEVATFVQPFGERLRRARDDKIGDGQIADRVHGIESDWHAGGGVPDEQRLAVDEGSRRERATRKECESENFHRCFAIFERRSQARWRSRE